MNLLNGLDKLNSTFPSQGLWSSLRKESLQRFQDQGLPTRKHEDWKYTSLKLLSDQFFTSSAANSVLSSPATIETLRGLRNPEMINLVFANGLYQPQLSDSQSLPQGVKLSQLSDVVKDSSDQLSQTCSDFILAFQKNYTALDYLNDSFIGQGLVLSIADETVVENPIQILSFTSLEGGVALATHSKFFLQLGRRSKATVFLRNAGQIGARYFTNANIYVDQDENSSLQLVQLQDDSELAVHSAHLFSRLKTAAYFHSLTLSLGSLLCRNNLDVVHQGAQSSCVIDGIYVVNKDQHVDNHTCIDHQVGACNSSQTYKGVLSQMSRAVFNGKVIIRKGADLANSEQINQNLLMDSTAEVDTKPELEIFADDVKATHGATVGQVNQEEVFYLMSRAIAKLDAVQMLGFGFIAELVYKLANSTVSSGNSAVNSALAEVLLQKLQAKLK